MSASSATRTNGVSVRKKRRDSSKSTDVPTVLRDCGGGWCWKGEQESRDGSRHFSAITKNSKVICIGDIVLIHGSAKQKYYIAKILAFTENTTDQQACANVEWLYWPSELSKLLKKFPKHQHPNLPPYLSNEVIFTNCKDSVEVSSIAGKTGVTTIAPSTTSIEKGSTARYVARWHFNSKTRKVIPLISSKQVTISAKTSPLKEGQNAAKTTSPQSNKVTKVVTGRTVQQCLLSNSENQESPIPKSMLRPPSVDTLPPKSPISNTPATASGHTPSNTSRHTPFKSPNTITAPTNSSPSRQPRGRHYYELFSKKSPKPSPLSTPKQKHIYNLSSALTPKNVSLQNKTPSSTIKQTDMLSSIVAKSTTKKTPPEEKQSSIQRPNRSSGDDTVVVTPQASLTPELKDGSFSSSSSTKSSPSTVGCRRQLKLDVSDVLESLDIDVGGECSDMEVENEVEPTTIKSQSASSPEECGEDTVEVESVQSSCAGQSAGETASEKHSNVTGRKRRNLRSTRKSQRFEEDEDPLTTIVCKSPSKPTRRKSVRKNTNRTVSFLSESDMETEDQKDQVETPEINNTNKTRMTRSQAKKQTSKETTSSDTDSNTPDMQPPQQQQHTTTSVSRNTRSRSKRTAMNTDCLESDVLTTATVTPRITRSNLRRNSHLNGISTAPVPRNSLRNSKNKTPSTAKSTTKPKRKRKRIVQQVKRSRVVAACSSEDDSPYMTESDQDSDDQSMNEDDKGCSDEDFVDMRTRKVKTPRTLPRTRKRPSPNATPVSAKKRRISVSASTTKSKRVKSILKKATAVQRRKCLTPCIPQRIFCKKQSGDHFDIAKERLHVSAVPESLPCRENEFASILSFVEGKLHSKTGGCMYISGVPGTGKTATVMEVTGYLRQAAEDKELPDFKFVDINGMRLTDPHQVYVSILKQLTGEKATPTHAATLLDKYFSSNKNKTPTVLLADELDLLWTRKQTVLYNLFEWPSRHQAKLIVLAVANTMDLPERIMMNKVSSRLGLTRLTFHPYTFQQLQEIVTSRMTGLKVFEPDAIQLAARKVAAVSGDARRALDISRRATEIAQSERNHEGKKKTRETGLVGMHHVDKAVQEMFSSAKIQAIKHVSLHEKMFLKGILSEFRRTGLEETTFKQVCQQLQVLYRAEGIVSANMTQLSCICSRLGGRRLLLVEGGRMDIHRRIRLNISQDDVIFALRDT